MLMHACIHNHSYMIIQDSGVHQHSEDFCKNTEPFQVFLSRQKCTGHPHLLAPLDHSRQKTFEWTENICMTTQPLLEFQQCQQAPNLTKQCISQEISSPCQKVCLYIEPRLSPCDFLMLVLVLTSAARGNRLFPLP